MKLPLLLTATLCSAALAVQAASPCSEGNAAKAELLASLNANAASVAVAAPAAAVTQDTALALAKQYNCLACHSLDSKIVGPAWREVGKKYAADNAAAQTFLRNKIKQGGKGVWGEIPMPPNPTLSQADLEALVGFILSLR